jgi:hypothetical protein
MNKLPQREGKDTREETTRQVQTEIEGEVKREIVNVFRELLERLWERLASLIGETATAAIFQSARREVARDYPFLNRVDIDESGVRLNHLQQDLSALERTTLRGGLLALSDGVVALLTDLTGDILVRKVQPLVQQFKQQLEED